jgi:hypothetical protein
MLNEWSDRVPGKRDREPLGDELSAVAAQVDALGERAAARHVSAAARLMFGKRNPIVARLATISTWAVALAVFAAVAIGAWQMVG